MPLNAAGLFGGSQDVGIRYEEQREFPSVADTEMVLWHIASGDGERQTGQAASGFAMDNVTYNRLGQSYTVGFQGPKADVSQSGIQFLMWRTGTPGSVTCSLYRADSADGKPYGSALTSGSFDIDSITTSQPGEYVTFTFSAAQETLYGERFACILSCAGADASNIVHVNANASATYDTATGKEPGYVEKGYGLRSTDGGSTYLTPSGTDTAFKTIVTGDLLLVNINGTIRDITLFDTGWKNA